MVYAIKTNVSMIDDHRQATGVDRSHCCGFQHVSPGDRIHGMFDSDRSILL